MRVTAGTRTVAIFEMSKGLLVLFTGAGLIGYIHRDAEKAADNMVRLFHLDPASRYPHILFDAISKVTDTRLWLLAAAALAYAAARFAEAYGLWHGRKWAAWFGLISGSIYVPWEVYELMRRVTTPRIVILVVNLIVVFILAWQLARERRAKHPAML